MSRQEKQEESDIELDIDIDVDQDPESDEELDTQGKAPVEADDSDMSSVESDSDDEYEFAEPDEFAEAETTQTIVKDEQRITSDVLSKYELVELINIRATQISKGNRVFTDITGLRDPVSMAKKEIYDNQCPLLVKRHLGNNLYEIWNPNEMPKPKI
jgi:DNA-directed RNA polymerase subunit K/omega